MSDMVVLNDDKSTVLVNVHAVDQCAGQNCCIHNPSDHHMKPWKPTWDPAFKMMMRSCPHRLLHPDPDDMAFLRRRWSPRAAARFAQHVCDGCCQPYGM